MNPRLLTAGGRESLCCSNDCGHSLACLKLYYIYIVVYFVVVFMLLLCIGVLLVCLGVEGHSGKAVCMCACLVTKRYKINSNNCSLTSNYNTVCIT